MKSLVAVPLALLLLLALPPVDPANIFEGLLPADVLRRHGLALEAVFSMGLRLQAIMDASSNENFVVSPLSTTAIISQLLLGTEGEFQEQLHDLLYFPDPNNSYSVIYNNKGAEERENLPYANIHFQLSSLIKMLQKRKDGELFTLNLNNALFYNEDIELRSFFKRTLQVIYDTDIRPLNLRKDNTVEILNQWAEKSTNGLIKTILNAPLPLSTAALFANSIYFKAEWETPFSDIINVEDKFHLDENNTVEATYMTGSIPQVLYAETKDYRVTCLPYQNRELGMYVILPNKDNAHKYDMSKFIETLRPQELLQTIANAKPKEVIVRIPKLSLSNTLSILKPLQKYSEYKRIEQTERPDATAVEKVLDLISSYKNFTASGKTDIYLTRAAKFESLRVSDVIQQMIFSINEKGTEAAAVLLGITDYMGGAKTMVMNRPFTFFIRHEATLATLFWGTIVDPTKN